jgi:hypothetical protein
MATRYPHTSSKGEVNMRFKLMLRGRGYIGAAGQGEKIDASDTATTELGKRIWYIVPGSKGLFGLLMSGGKQTVQSGFIKQSDYNNMKDADVLMDNQTQLVNIRPPSYALYRVGPNS